MASEMARLGVVVVVVVVVVDSGDDSCHVPLTIWSVA